MPPAKKKKTLHDSCVFLDSSDSSDSAFEPVRVHKKDKISSSRRNDKSKSKDTETTTSADPAPHSYICVHRPFFDVEAQNWVAWKEDPASHLEETEDVVEKLYKPGFEQENKIYKDPASEHPGHKWVMMWAAWVKKEELGRKAKYCDPDAFGMHLYNDWRGWGMQEICENVMLEFDKAFRSKGDTRVEEMWTVISAVGLWLNENEHIGALIENEDGETTCELIGLIGCALLTALAGLEAAAELKPDSRFLDLTLVIAYYLELSHDLPAYGIEGDYVAWRREAVHYFRKAGLDPKKALSTTKLRIEQLGKVDGEAAPGNSAENPVTILDDSQTDKENTDPETSPEKLVSPPPSAKRKRGTGNTVSERHWTGKFQEYKEGRAPVMGGHKYDITKMSRVDRAAAAFDGKDPLAGVSDKDLKDGLLGFA